LGAWPAARERVEEGLDGRLVSPRRRPNQPSTVVVDNHGQVAMARSRRGRLPPAGQAGPPRASLQPPPTRRSPRRCARGDPHQLTRAFSWDARIRLSQLFFTNCPRDGFRGFWEVTGKSSCNRRYRCLCLQKTSSFLNFESAAHISRPSLYRLKITHIHYAR
jgi:hypothetical protein